VDQPTPHVRSKRLKKKLIEVHPPTVKSFVSAFSFDFFSAGGFFLSKKAMRSDVPVITVWGDV